MFVAFLQVPPAAAVAHAAWVKGQKEVDVLMLLTMDLDIQRNLAHLSAYDMLQELKAMFSKQAKQELLLTVREFHAYKQEEGFRKTRKINRTKLLKGGHGKGKSKMGYAPNNAPFAPKPKTPPPPKKDNPAKDAICHQCGEIGHWRRTGLWGSKKLKPSALSQCMGDGNRAAVEAIGTYHLELHSGLIIVLKNCHYASSITRGKCVFCMFGKMARKPYSHQVERAKDLLGLIHTDVCGPFRIMSRQGANYFVTFTDYFSCYGYVYLLKHKHEVFETFTVFKKEVENQLEKTIKSLRSDRGGYLEETMRYSFYNPSENKIFVTRNAKFFENDLIDLKGSGSVKDLELIQEEDKIELPPNARTVGSKWLLKKKTDIDGAVYVFKARLVAKGFTQTYRIDYEETFSPVAYIRAIRVLISIAAYYDYAIWQMEASGNYVTILILYVDDILLMGNNIPMLQYVKSYLGRSFAMKDLRDAAYILGIKIYRDRSKRLIGLCQSAYIEKILKRYYMENSKCGTIPMQEKLKLSKSQGASTPAKKQRMQNVPYASAIG
uniref:Retrotransposon protein, putative, Ty1-copia subclass n=1 Tax=Tanacetum cinerariifolium TaxID=118510 RepID=A0A6L2M026_TANCI|nr:retrotransposon protein, putative, Ty1-copia subclass [Tanacetum cinerariifolium]